jgi:hypothetical protein
VGLIAVISKCASAHEGSDYWDRLPERFNGIFAEGFGCLCGKGYLSSEYACHDSRPALIGDAYASRCRSKSELRAKGKGRCSCRPGNKATARQESSSYTCNVKCKRDSISVTLESLS